MRSQSLVMGEVARPESRRGGELPTLCFEEGGYLKLSRVFAVASGTRHMLQMFQHCSIIYPGNQHRKFIRHVAIRFPVANPFRSPTSAFRTISGAVYGGKEKRSERPADVI
jgi:hypothetical protein